MAAVDGKQGGVPPAPLRVADCPGGVRIILMEDPRDRNPINPAMRTVLSAALKAAAGDPAVRAIVLGGAGKNFSVGGDIADIESLPGGQQSHARMKSVGEFAQMVDGFAKPVIAALAGHCLGAGAGVALLCDAIVMEKSSTIGFPFLKIGLCPDFGVTHTLPRRIGAAAAARALLHARSFSAEEAARIGLADEVVDDGGVLARAAEIAAQLGAMPAYALGLTKGLLREPAATLAACLEQEAMSQAICFGSPDMKEGLAAFREKRPARFNRLDPASGD